jgi:hypothetical protein
MFSGFRPAKDQQLRSESVVEVLSHNQYGESILTPARLTRRGFLRDFSLAAGAGFAAKPAVMWAGVESALASAASRGARGTAVPNRPALAPAAFCPLPLTSVRPAGWLRRQMEIYANGLSGHLDEFWTDVGPASGWLGGSGESWERGPYFLDGLVPLSFLLEDDRLIAKARKWVDWTLDHQALNGMIGPSSNDDWWPRIVMLKVLTQFQEATGDPRVIPVLQRYFACQSAQLPSRPLRDWGRYRWQDELVSVLWLYNRTGDATLLDLARLLHRQGYDWRSQFENFTYTQKMNAPELGLKLGEMDPDLAMQTHGVNNAMALKQSAVWWQVSRDPADREFLLRQLQTLDRFHGIPNGMFSADEHFAGRNPAQGIELCAVVEMMFSLQQGIAILGNPSLADRLEQIAYNALPGATTADAWAHQYDQQPNQILCTLAKRPWSTNGPESNLFGLEPNFGCCTANMHQGWPKFAASLWMSDAKGGLAAIAYSPCEVHTEVAHGIPVSIKEATDYPFREEISLEIDPASPAKFPIQLRIPAWARGAEVRVNQKLVEGVEPGTFLTLSRRWKRGDQVHLRLPMRPRVSRACNNSLVVERGPVIFSLDLKGEFRKLRPQGMTADWEVYPQAPWNYALDLNERNVEATLTVREGNLGSNPFAVDSEPVQIGVKGRRVPEWQMVENVAAPPPEGPVASAQPDETLTLVPYAAAKLRITAFPELKNA